MKDNIISLKEYRKTKIDSGLITFRNPYHIDNIIEDIKRRKEMLYNPITYGAIIGCDDDEPKKINMFKRWWSK